MTAATKPREETTRAPRGGWRLLTLLFLLLLAPAPAPAQEADELEVVLATLSYLRSSLPVGAAALDPESFCQPRLIGWTCPEALRSAADSLGYRLNSRAFTHVCLGSEHSCRLIGTASLVHLARPQVARNTATVEASVWWRAGPRPHPVAHRRVRLSLAPGPDGWEVVGEEPIRED